MHTGTFEVGARETAERVLGWEIVVNVKRGARLLEGKGSEKGLREFTEGKLLPHKFAS